MRKLGSERSKAGKEVVFGQMSLPYLAPVCQLYSAEGKVFASMVGFKLGKGETILQPASNLPVETKTSQHDLFGAITRSRPSRWGWGGPSCALGLTLANSARLRTLSTTSSGFFCCGNIVACSPCLITRHLFHGVAETWIAWIMIVTCLKAVMSQQLRLCCGGTQVTRPYADQ